MKLALGTVQFGMPYGISNSSGQTPQSEAARILEVAQKHGVSLLDTAAAYGDSEAVLGECLHGKTSFKIVSKTAACESSSITENECLRFDQVLLRTLARTRQPSLYGLLVHQVDDLFKPGGSRLFERLLAARDNQLVEKIGVSVYSAADIDAVLERFKVDIVQVPINLLDQRLLHSGHLSKLKDRGIEIHARSVFLQGLLLMEPDGLPTFFNPVRPVLQSYHEKLNICGYTPLDAALGFVKNIAEVDAILVGVVTASQFEEVVAAYMKHPLLDYAQWAYTGDTRMLNPGLWETE